MSWNYISAEDAIAQEGLRMVVVSGVPSPWGEAAKAIFHVKNIDWSAVELTYDNPALKDWAGELSGPVAIYNKEKPRSGWADILLLAERLSATPALLPDDPLQRMQCFGLAHEIFGEQGLGWSRRLQIISHSLREADGFPQQTANYLAQKYGCDETAAAQADQRVIALLGMLASQLKAGLPYYGGDTLSAVDIYSACCINLFVPYPDEQCPMLPHVRSTFEILNQQTKAALDPVLIAHRDRIYQQYLPLPIRL